MTGLRDKVRAAAEYMEMVRRRPLLLFEITPRCNQDCIFCYNVWKDDILYSQNELEAGAVSEMLADALEGSGGRHVTFTGGEPLLRSDLEQVIGDLTRCDITTTVITNGTLLGEDRARSLVEAGVGLFEVPILGTERSLHDSLTRRAGSFDKAVDAVASIRSAGGGVVIVFVATRVNIEQWPDTVRLSMALGAYGILFNRFNPGGEGARHVGDLLPTIEQIRQALAEADRAVRVHGVPIGIPVPIPPCTVDHREYPHLRFHGCEAGTRNAYWTIDPVGNVRPCNHTPTILGNVRTEAFRDIKAKEETARWVKAVPSTCDRCEHLKSCRGGCKAAAQVCSGALDSEEPFVREYGRKAV